MPDLPPAEKLEEGIIFHSFEVEGIEDRPAQTGKMDDKVLEIKVLPDRAHDCLCHLGVAREAAAIFDLSLTKPAVKEVGIAVLPPLSINITDPKLCRRYVGRRVSGVKVGASPDWLRIALEAVGQRSINNIVDATNYVLFDLGQPLHAFDADKVVGAISVRSAKIGEKIITLDGREIFLDESILVIADEEGPLAIAGIKGGNRAEVDDNTKNLILESANFEPVAIRKTGAKINLRTDASKRYENELSCDTAGEAMKMLTGILAEVAGGEYGEIVDVYPTPSVAREISINPLKVNHKLGLNLSVAEMVVILKRLAIEAIEDGEQIKVSVPHWRLDLVEDVNVIEEVGRIYGYDKVAPIIFPDLPTGVYRAKKYERRFMILNKIRQILATAGFSEVMGYALTDKGDVELANPLASDKGYLRNNLVDWLNDRISFNLNHVLFDDEPVKIFEIGRIFEADLSEKIMLAVGISYRKKPKRIDAKNQLEEIVSKLNQDLQTDLRPAFSLDLNSGAGHIFTFELDLVDGSSDREVLADLSDFLSSTFVYKKISAYPRIIRDIAVWVPEETDIELVGAQIKKSAGPLCAEGPILFDEFVKDGRKSLAFRLVFQSFDKTLSDDEVNKEMMSVTTSLQSSGWEVR